MIESRSNGQSKRADGEAGYILIGVLILMALFVIALAVAAPIVAKSIERDKEVEAVHRGKQYIRAIKLYYKRFGAYPTSIDQLENTNNVRYLRKRYTDPMTGKDDWRLIHVGEAKVPVIGFFGQPLQAGVGSVTTGLAGNGTGGLQSAGNGNLFNNSPTGSPNGTSTDPNNSGTSSAPANPDGTPATPTYAMPGVGAGSGQPGGATGTQTGFNGSTTTGSGGSGFEAGGPIVGVGLPVDKKSLLIYHKQDSFKKWEFTYDPLQDQVMLSGSAINGATPIGTTPIGAGGATGGNPGSTVPGPSGSPTSTTTPTSSTTPDNPPQPNQ